MSLLVFGCDEDELCSDTCGILNDVTDLIAFLDPNQTLDDVGSLFLNEEYVSEVLAEFNAVPIGNGLYNTTVQTVEGEPVPFTFKLVPTSIPYLFVTNNEDPEEVLAKTKVYKDAECKNLTDASPPGDCTAFESEYYKAEAKKWDRCVAGSGICTEVETILFIIYYYEMRLALSRTA